MATNTTRRTVFTEDDIRQGINNTFKNTSAGEYAAEGAASCMGSL